MAKDSGLGNVYSDSNQPRKKTEDDLGEVYNQGKIEEAKARQRIEGLRLGEGVRVQRIKELEEEQNRTEEQNVHLERLRKDQAELEKHDREWKMRDNKE